MQYRDFGKTGLKVSEIGFGGWAIGGNEHGKSYGPTDDKVSLLSIRKAFELGCNFFETADVYGWGHSERLLGNTFKSQRDKVIFATKGGADFYHGMGKQDFSEKYLRFALEESLIRLKTDYVDIYLLHNPPLKFISRDSTYTIMRTLKQEGKIRAWGLSIFDPIEGLVALHVGRPDCLEVAYNLFNSRPAKLLFPLALENGCAIIAREPLANGFLSGKYDSSYVFESSDIRSTWRNDYIQARIIAAQKLSFLQRERDRTLAQASLKYVLAEQAVSVVIPGIKTPEQAIENLKASDLPHLVDKELKQIAFLQSTLFSL